MTTPFEAFIKRSDLKVFRCRLQLKIYPKQMMRKNFDCKVTSDVDGLKIDYVIFDEINRLAEEGMKE